MGTEIYSRLLLVCSKIYLHMWFWGIFLTFSSSVASGVAYTKVILILSLTCKNILIKCYWNHINPQMLSRSLEDMCEVPTLFWEYQLQSNKVMVYLCSAYPRRQWKDGWAVISEWICKGSAVGQWQDRDTSQENFGPVTSGKLLKNYKNYIFIFPQNRMF